MLQYTHWTPVHFLRDWRAQYQNFCWPSSILTWSFLNMVQLWLTVLSFWRFLNSPPLYCPCPCLAQSCSICTITYRKKTVHWCASAAYQASLVEPWFVIPDNPSWEQPSLRCCFTVPMFAISQSEAVSTVLIFCDIKSLAWYGYDIMAICRIWMR